MGMNKEQSSQVNLLENQADQPLLPLEEGQDGQYTGDGSVDIHGRPSVRQNTGNWSACLFVLGTECCERLAYYGININLVTYLITKLHEGNADAAKNVNNWSGTCFLTPLLGAVLADAYWGRYWTIAVFSTIYFIFEGIGISILRRLFRTYTQSQHIEAFYHALIGLTTTGMEPGGWLLRTLCALTSEPTPQQEWSLVDGLTLCCSEQGMATLTISASVSVLQPPSCTDSVCPKATTLESAVFFLGLYLIAFGTGGIKPCVSSFGADQFDDTDPKERKKKGSFFNWFYFSISFGTLVSSSVIVWVQDNVGWGWGFAIPTIFVGLAIINLFSATPLYRLQKPGGSPLTRLCQVIVASLRKLQKEVPQDSSMLYEVQDKRSVIQGSRKIEHTNDLNCLDKAAIITDDDIQDSGFSNPWKLCTVTQVEELKILVRMFPIWVSGIVFAAVYSQMSTMFIEQGMTMDTSIGSFEIPAASLSTFDVLSVMIWVPVYDRIIVPIARKYTGKEKGFTQLQRMGIGLVISIISMTVAALVEIKRLDIVRTHDLGHDTVTPVPMTILWQIPQYSLIGAAEVFFVIGHLEFFYDQSPDAMRSLCSALSLLTGSLGSYLSTLIVTIVTSITTKGGKQEWIPDNLNEGHLDYYFWLLAFLSFLNWLVYIVCVQRYQYKKANWA